MDIRPPTDKELETLPAIMLTNQESWDPSVLDNEYDDSNNFAKDFPDSTVNIDPRFNAMGEYNYGEKQAITAVDENDKDLAVNINTSYQTYTVEETPNASTASDLNYLGSNPTNPVNTAPDSTQQNIADPTDFSNELSNDPDFLDLTDFLGNRTLDQINEEFEKLAQYQDNQEELHECTTYSTYPPDYRFNTSATFNVNRLGFRHVAFLGISTDNPGGTEEKLIFDIKNSNS